MDGSVLSSAVAPASCSSGVGNALGWTTRDCGVGSGGVSCGARLQFVRAAARRRSAQSRIPPFAPANCQPVGTQ